MCRTEVRSSMGTTRTMKTSWTPRHFTRRAGPFTCVEAALLISSEPRKWKVRSRPTHSSVASRTDEGERDRERRSLHMPATGELIRLMNYVDDISATLRRISSTIGTMTAEEKKRLSEYMRAATNGFNDVLTQLEKQ